MSEWQPIETAPKDGTVVDLWSPDYGRLTNEWWDIQEQCWTIHGISNPTHWMPLPEPPK